MLRRSAGVNVTRRVPGVDGRSAVRDLLVLGSVADGRRKFIVNTCGANFDFFHGVSNAVANVVCAVLIARVRRLRHPDPEVLRGNRGFDELESYRAA